MLYIFHFDLLFRFSEDPGKLPRLKRLIGNKHSWGSHWNETGSNENSQVREMWYHIPPRQHPKTAPPPLSLVSGGPHTAIIEMMGHHSASKAQPLAVISLGVCLSHTAEHNHSQFKGLPYFSSTPVQSWCALDHTLLCPMTRSQSLAASVSQSSKSVSSFGT